MVALVGDGDDPLVKSLYSGEPDVMALRTQEEGVVLFGLHPSKIHVSCS